MLPFDSMPLPSFIYLVLYSTNSTYRSDHGPLSLPPTAKQNTALALSLQL